MVTGARVTVLLNNNVMHRDVLPLCTAVTGSTHLRDAIRNGNLDLFFILHLLYIGVFAVEDIRSAMHIHRGSSSNELR